MSIDIGRAASFLASHGRLLDRRRLTLAVGEATDQQRAAVLAALDGYRNPDGGYGWGLEPDLRAAESQPAGALHALEAIAEAAPQGSPATTGLLDWLEAATLPDGGLPFALPVADPTGCAPFWAGADASTSSLHITMAVAAQAQRLARSDQQVREHPWLTSATGFCLRGIAALGETPSAHVLSYALQLLDSTSQTSPQARELLGRLGTLVPGDGALAVQGGSEGETIGLLGFAPEPGRPVRDLVDRAAVEAALDRLEAGQQPDGGWAVDFVSYSPAATVEWRGYATVGAVATLRANGRWPTS